MVLTCISQTSPALPTTLLMLMPSEPIPVAVAVPLAEVVAVDVTTALVKVVSVVDDEPIVIPGIPPMSMLDISMLGPLLYFFFK